MREESQNGVHRRRRALLSRIIAFAWLAMLSIGALTVLAPQRALALGQERQDKQTIALPKFTSPTPIGSPQASATPTETKTPAVTRTASPTRAPTQSNFTPGPQPTRVTFSQPTVGASARFDSPGITGAPDGPNGLVIATITSCITALLALITTAIAFSVLRRGGYAPFLRTLLLGARAGKRGQTRAGGSRGRNSARRALGGAHDEVNRLNARSRNDYW
jgi:hypothetical protein